MCKDLQFLKVKEEEGELMGTGVERNRPGSKMHVM